MPEKTIVITPRISASNVQQRTAKAALAQIAGRNLRNGIDHLA